MGRPETGITPGRTVTVTFDSPEYILSQRPWSAVRLFSQVAAADARDKAINSTSATNLYHWSSGCWTLRPRHLRPWQVQEKQPAVTVLSAAPVAAVPGRQQPLYKNFTGTGGSAGTDNAPDGNDSFFTKIVDALTSWNFTGVLAGTTRNNDLAGVLAAPPVLLGEAQPKATQPIDPIMHVAADAAPNQPICLRWQVPGSGLMAFQFIGSLYFGQYCLVLYGDGMAELWEHAKKKGASEATWQKRTSFRYCRAELVAGFAHSLIIFPHVGLTGEKYVAFASAQMDSPGVASAGLLSAPKTGGGAGSTTSGEYLWRWDEVLTNSEDITHTTYDTGDSYTVSRHISTIGGPIWLYERRDLRCSWQVSPVEWESAGRLVDLNAAQPYPAGGEVNLVAYSQAPSSSTLTPKILDTNEVVWTGPGDTPSPCRAAFEFKPSAGNAWTPILWGYRLQRPGTYLLATPGSFDTTYNDLSIRQGSRELANEGADFTVKDVYGEWPRLRNRGELNVRIHTNFKPAVGDEVDLTLFKGYAVRPHATRYGKTGAKAGAMGTGIDRTNEDWSDIQINAVGMWHRLTPEATSMRSCLSLRDFFQDPSDSQKRPWKVVTVISYLLQAAGFPLSMISLPTIDIRLNPGIGGEQSDLVIDQSLGVGEVIVRLARMYLGMTLAFDANAGTHGKWKLLGAPTDTTAKMHFVGHGGAVSSTPGTYKLPVHPQNYAANTVPYIGHLESYTAPPEVNHLWVCNKVDVFSGPGGLRMENHLHNYLSYKVPGSTIDPDPDSPHYIPGGQRTVIVADQALWAGAGANTGGYDASQQIIDYILLRLFRYACMGRRIKTFTAPLQPVWDATESRWRLPRFYDVVTFDGQTGWYVRSCSPEIQHGHLQKATYQIERLEPYLTA